MMATYQAWVEWVEAFPTSTAIREAIYGYPSLLTLHVVGVAIFAGLVLMMDLRLVGIGNRGTAFSVLQKRLFPWQLFGMAITTVSGLLLVYGQPTRVHTNIFFWLKTIMMVLAGINALAFHQSTYRSIARWDRVAPPFSARWFGLVSVILWAGVIVTGRMIGYNWFVVR